MASAAALNNLSGSQVAVLDAKSLRLVASGQLDPGDTFTTRVTEGSYLVCISPPSDWKPVSGGVSRVDGWICKAEHVGASAAAVKFMLVRAASSATGVMR